MLYDWKAAIWTIVLSGLIALIISFFVYSPAFYLTLFGGAENEFSASKHWARLSDSLVAYYLPIGFAAGISLIFMRMFVHKERRIGVLGVFLAGLVAGICSTFFVILTDPQPWFNIFSYHLGAAIIAIVNWATIPVVLSVLICATIWIIRDFVGLRSL